MLGLTQVMVLGMVKTLEYRLTGRKDRVHEGDVFRGRGTGGHVGTARIMGLGKDRMKEQNESEILGGNVRCRNEEKRKIVRKDLLKRQKVKFYKRLKIVKKELRTQ